MPPARFSFPKSSRLLHRADYRRIYDEGQKFAGPLFAAFYRRSEAGGVARVGFTTPKALGPAVARNRIKRRLREAVRVQLPEVATGWEIVLNPRRAVLDAEFPRLEAEISRLFRLLRQPPAIDRG